MELHQAQNKIQRILRDNLYQRSSLSTTGSLNFNRLSKYRTSKKLFDRKNIQSWKHYNVTLLLDMSWSMGDGKPWSRAYDTIKATQNIIKLLKWVAQLKVSIFNWYHFDNIDKDELVSLKSDDQIYKYIYYYMHKEIYIDEDNNITLNSKNPTINQYTYSYNVESIDIEYEAKELMWKDWEPILIVLQDWSLEASHIADCKYLNKSISKYLDGDFVRELYSKISKQVYLLSIWIQTTNPRSYFDNFAYVDDASKIYDVVIKVFERLIS